MGTPAPVFVDASGRRARLLRRCCWVLASILFGYVLLVVAALVAPSDVLALRVPGLGPVLPGTGAPSLTTQDGRQQDPAEAASSLPTPSPRAPLPPASRTSPQPRGASPTPVSVPVTAPRPSATGRPSAQPTTAPSTRPTTPGRASGRPSARPTPRATKTKPTRP